MFGKVDMLETYHKPISIDGKMANPPFLERDEEREHTDGLARR